jgi:hypothetical protein
MSWKCDWSGGALAERCLGDRPRETCARVEDDIGVPLSRLCLRGELQEGLNACAGTVSMASELQGAHDRECDAPAEDPLCVHAGRRGEPLGARLDCLEIIRLPQDQVDRVEGGIAEAGCRVDRG